MVAVVLQDHRTPLFLFCSSSILNLPCLLFMQRGNLCFGLRSVLGRVMMTVDSFRLLVTCFSSRFMELQMCFRWGAMDGHRWIFSLFSLTSSNNVTFVVFMLIFVMEGLVQTYSSRFSRFFRRWRCHCRDFSILVYLLDCSYWFDILYQ